MENNLQGTPVPAAQPVERQKTEKEIALDADRARARADLRAVLGRKPLSADVYKLVSYRKKGIPDEKAFKMILNPGAALNKTRKNSGKTGNLEAELRRISERFVDEVLKTVVKYSA
jgi:hypothetical protein